MSQISAPKLVVIGNLLFLLSTTFLSAQGPLDGYLKGKGRLDIAPSFSFNKANTFDGNGTSFAEGYRGSLLSVFAEYGLTERLDLVATANYVFTADQSGLQDGGIYAKYLFAHKKFDKVGTLHALGGFGYSFPLSDYEATANGALGTKAKVVPARLILQMNTNLGFFVNLTGGWNFRFDKLLPADIQKIQTQRPDYQTIQPADYATFLFKIGLPAKRYYLDAWAEYQHTKGGADYVQGLPDLAQSFGVTYAQIGGTAYYSESGKNGVYLSGGYILSGRNVSRILRITAGVVMKL